MRPETAVYLDAARMFAGLVHRIDPEAWDGPGLGGWDLRALVGHTSRSLVTVLTYIEQPAETEAITSARDYYALIAGLDIDPTDILERGRQAGEQLGSDPASAIDELIERVTARLDGVDENMLITTIGGGMRIAVYMPTRTFELAVHCLDIVAATGLELEIPESVLADATGLAVSVAVALGKGQTVLNALTGRRDLPPGFSVTI